MIAAKILDNTVISAFVIEIASINITDLCVKQYDLVTTSCVYDETSKAIGMKMLDDVYKNISVIKRDGEVNYDSALEYLRNRYPYLHEGELSAFLIALIDFECQRKPYYFVTDDGKMRSDLRALLRAGSFNPGSWLIMKPILAINTKHQSTVRASKIRELKGKKKMLARDLGLRSNILTILASKEIIKSVDHIIEKGIRYTRWAPGPNYDDFILAEGRLW
jgi:hypothetical protein